jgi:hypothetical protein
MAEMDSDLLWEAAVLRSVLIVHPESLTREELCREMTYASTAFEERDRVERAVRDLGASGLVQRNGDFVVPTRAAVRFWSLMDV